MVNLEQPIVHYWNSRSSSSSFLSTLLVSSK